MEYPYLQENGQMKYGGPPRNWEGPPPPKGTEVFVSRLPRDATLSEICPVFALAGKIYSARLMMDFSGTNRGFCFIQYSTKVEAKYAISQLHNHEIRTNIKICVTKSIDNCRLFIGQIPKHLKKDEIRDIIGSVTTGLKDVILYLSPTDKSVNRGFCFAEYNDHRSAAMARRSLIAGGIADWGRDVRIDWAIPEDEVDESVMSQVTVVYARNLMLKTTENTLKDLICKIIAQEDITRIRKVKDFAFIHFRTRHAAEKAIEYLDGFILDGAKIHATWAKPTPNVDLQSFVSECSDGELEYLRHELSYQMKFSSPLLPKKEKVKKKLEKKKEVPKEPDIDEVLSKQLQDVSTLNNLDDRVAVNYSPPPLFINTAVPPSISPTFHYSMDNSMLVPYGAFPPVPPPLNTLSVVPFVCPPSPLLKDREIRSVVESILKSNHPAGALRNIIPYLGWGEVFFSVSFDVDENSCAIFSAQIVIVKPDRTVQYPQVFHPRAYTPYDAKNMAALVFIKTFILRSINQPKLTYT